MDSELAKTPYFAGAEFSAADIQMSFPLVAATARGGLDSSRRHLWAYLQTLQVRPGYERANARGGALTLGG